jgi:hypothetical protein
MTTTITKIGTQRTLMFFVIVVSFAAFVPYFVVEARQMDPKQVAGIPLPVGDVPAGTVVVRVIKGSLANNMPDQPVELQGTDPVRTVKTDATGRARFDGLKPGTQIKAVATVNGERLQSQEFAVPGSGGVRLLLVATDPEAAKGEKPAGGTAQPGTVVLGEQSRFVFEIGDGSLSVFNLLQILNTGSTPVQPPQPLVFELPSGATGASLMQDSSPQATAAGRRVTVTGPFPPGNTLVQFAYSLPYSGGDLTVQQAMPVPLNRVIVLAQKSGADMRLQSSYVSEQREMAAEGQTYIVGQGPAVRAGESVTFNFSNLPHEPLWPRNLAVALALLILAGGAWASTRVGDRAADKNRNRLETKRNQLFAELTSVEEQHREGRLDPQRYAARRRELVAALERIYAEIDRQAA